MYRYSNLRLRRIIPLVIAVGLLASGLVFYRRNHDLIANFKPYYYKSYLAAYKYQAESLALDVVGRHPAQAASVSGNAQSIPVLLYHGVITDQPDGANITIDNFIAQMLALKKAGYQTLTIDQYYQAIYNNKPVPAKSFLLTFDDGRKDSYYPADPLLKALHYHATMFVITGASFAPESRFYLSKVELQRMQHSGRWDLQAHARDGHFLYPVDAYTKGHFYSNKLWLANQNRYETDQEFQNRVLGDLQAAKADMKANLGIDSVSFAFPFGDLGEDQSNYANAKTVLLADVAQVYKLAFYQFWEGRGYSQNYVGSGQLLNERIEVEPSWNAQKTVDALTGGAAKPLPYQVTPSERDGWLVNWGSGFFTGQGLILDASTKSTGAAATLDGTGGWHNYIFTAMAQLVRGQDLRLMARVQDNSGYVSCSFSPTLVEAQLSNGGVSSYKSGTPGAYDLAASGATIGIQVQDNVVTCLLNGQAVSRATISVPNLTTTGGIGFVVEDPNTNTAEGVLKHVQVTALP